MSSKRSQHDLVLKWKVTGTQKYMEMQHWVVKLILTKQIYGVHFTFASKGTDDFRFCERKITTQGAFKEALPIREQ